MELKNFFRNSSNNVYNQNMDLLEDYDLITPMGSPNKLFLKFLNSKNLKIKEDELTSELVEEFESSIDSINLRLAKIQKEKEIIFRQEKVWINIPVDDEWVGSDLLLEHDGVTIEKTGEKLLYSEMADITIEKGGWSKNRIIIDTFDDEFVFEINDAKAVPLKEILEDNIDNQTHDEFDDLLDLYALFDEGKISEEELEVRKALIYSDDRYCTECGIKLDPDSDYCSHCGHKVD
ncbi:MAG: zinc ribbon domain-containing protein [Methanobrevibacter sp.]|nr:zinc ribbon domain-containing protein [Methanobrevibacter sp.]